MSQSGIFVRMVICGCMSTNHEVSEAEVNSETSHDHGKTLETLRTGYSQTQSLSVYYKRSSQWSNDYDLSPPACPGDLIFPIN